VEDSGNRALPGEAAQPADLLQELEGRANELEQLVREIKSTYGTMLQTRGLSERARLRKVWIEQTARWTGLQQQFEELMQVFERRSAAVRVRARSRRAARSASAALKEGVVAAPPAGAAGAAAVAAKESA
jgi:hypothetical protein